MCRECLWLGTHGMCNGITAEAKPVPMTQRQFVAIVRAAAGLAGWESRYATCQRGGFTWVEWAVGARQLYVSLSQEGELRIERRESGEGELSERLTADELPERIHDALGWLTEGLLSGPDTGCTEPGQEGGAP